MSELLPMRKRISIFVLCSFFIWQAPVRCDNLTPRASSPSRGLFVSLIQNPPTLSNREAIMKLVDFAKKARIKILFVQIYRANQAWFPSKVGDPAPYEAALKTLGEDPFAFLIQEAHDAGIEVHAWLNMLSLSANEDAPLLKKYGSDILTRNPEEKRTLADYKIDSQYFLEPGDTRVRKELVAMVEEIVRTYPLLDGVQFDYIRYPDSHPRYGYTPVNMERFRNSTGLKKIKEGSRAWNDWKRAQVTELLKLLVQKARAIRSDIHVSATGCMSYVRALHEAFQDWPSWVNSGLVDFVTVMNYSPDPAEYEQWTGVAKDKVSDRTRLYMGVGVYKLVHAPEVFEKEFRSCAESGIGLCAVFHYGSLLENPALEKPLLSREKDPRNEKV
ncbi:MAG: family 10 glycosylhydrolase [Candidatus Omnitrophota bacterium]